MGERWREQRNRLRGGSGSEMWSNDSEVALVISSLECTSWYTRLKKAEGVQFFITCVMNSLELRKTASFRRIWPKTSENNVELMHPGSIFPLGGGEAGKSCKFQAVGKP
ncbi:hypothetical protein M5W86_24255, partial [Paenibacillus thiaminolyticus]